ncbi:PAAR domain-containing protein [Chromobacterium sp. ASV23]|uniref:PAAR domain-containing protein n=1 Tax=Chromobacterium sp. ASV23 TaxID=2795110 RepID=UPI001E42C97B|nr:PAAR domain-containing protein [Chromobacterium sp. ASV23]
MGKAIIREGDSTSHGGTVLEAFPTLTVYGKNAAGIGHQVSCPKCKGNFPIVAGAANYTFMGKNVAVEGMQTSCGAVLIASQGQATVDNTPGASSMMAGAAGAASVAAAAAAIAGVMFNEKYQLRDEEGQPLKNAEYTIIRADGSKEHGKSDGSGYTHMIDDHEAAEVVAIHIGDFDA